MTIIQCVCSVAAFTRSAKEKHPEPGRTHAGNHHGHSPQRQPNNHYPPVISLLTLTKPEAVISLEAMSAPLSSRHPSSFSCSPPPPPHWLSQKWTERMISLPGILVEPPTARNASSKDPRGCREAGCARDGRRREGTERRQGWGRRGGVHWEIMRQAVGTWERTGKLQKFYVQWKPEKENSCTTVFLIVSHMRLLNQE